MRKLLLGCAALLVGLVLVGVAHGQAGLPAATATAVHPDWLDRIGKTSQAQTVADPDGYPWLRLPVRGIPMVFAWPSGNPYWQEYTPLPLDQRPSGPRAYVSSYPGYPGVYLITQFAFYTVEKGQPQRVYDRIGLVATGEPQDGAYVLTPLTVPANGQSR